MPTIGTATIAVRVEPEGARVGNGTVVAVAPSQPIVPRPLWERDALFQEPAYADGLELLGDDSDDEDAGDGA